MPKKVTVVRCPKCGSTNAGEDVSRSVFENHLMSCADCGHEEYADHYQIGDDWNLEIELADDATELPKKVAPRGAGH